MSALENNSALPLALVRPTDLFEIFDQVVGVYAFVACAYIGRVNAAPHPDMDLEFSVRVRGAVQARVVIRCRPSAARLLAEGIRVEGRASDAESADALREVCNLFVGHLLTRCLGGHRQAFEPFLPEPSRPEDWPKREPDAACALLLETESVEVRYWQEARS